jgi:hypothetical protein
MFAEINVLRIKSSRRPEIDYLYKYNYDPVLYLFLVGLSLFLLGHNFCRTVCEQRNVERERKGVLLV